MKLKMITALALLSAGLMVTGCEDKKPAADEKKGAVSEAPAEGDKKAEGEKKDEGAAKAPEKKADGEKAEGNAGEKAETMAAKIGAPAPAFTLKDEAGKEHKLADYKGKIVVLEWTCATCPYVERHYKAKTMAKTHEAVGKDDVVWLAIDSTKTVKAEANAEWKAKEGFAYPVLTDASGAVGKLYGAKTTPHMYVIDAKGNLAYSGAIDDDVRGKNEKAKNYVIETVNALKKGEKVPASETKPYGCSVKYAG